MLNPVAFQVSIPRFDRSRSLMFAALAIALAGCSVNAVNTSTKDSRGVAGSVIETPRIKRRDRFNDRKELTDFCWQVLLATTADGRPIPVLQPDDRNRITVAFHDTYMSIYGAPNTSSGKYQLEPGIIRSSDMITTVVGTSDRRDAATDQAVGEHMQGPYRYEVEGHGALQRLFLTSHDGSQFVLQTTDAPYGAKLRMLYLEVAAEERECEDVVESDILGPTCLWVRERKPGPEGESYSGGWSVASGWYKFPGWIRNYEHKAGVHEVVAVKHYPAVEPLPKTLKTYISAGVRSVADVPEPSDADFRKAEHDCRF